MLFLDAQVIASLTDWPIKLGTFSLVGKALVPGVLIINKVQIAKMTTIIELARLNSDFLSFFLYQVFVW